MEETPPASLFPENYVTLKDLQERWLKRKQDEEANEEKLRKLQDEEKQAKSIKAGPSIPPPPESKKPTRSERRPRNPANGSKTKEWRGISFNGAGLKSPAEIKSEALPSSSIRKRKTKSRQSTRVPIPPNDSDLAVKIEDKTAESETISSIRRRGKEVSGSAMSELKIAYKEADEKGKTLDNDQGVLTVEIFRRVESQCKASSSIDGKKEMRRSARSQRMHLDSELKISDKKAEKEMFHPLDAHSKSSSSIHGKKKMKRSARPKMMHPSELDSELRIADNKAEKIHLDSELKIADKKGVPKADTFGRVDAESKSSSSIDGRRKEMRRSTMSRKMHSRDLDSKVAEKMAESEQGDPAVEIGRQLADLSVSDGRDEPAGKLFLKRSGYGRQSPLARGMVWVRKTSSN